MSPLVGVVMGVINGTAKIELSSGKVATWNLLQYVQHNPRNNKRPMADILSGIEPPPDAQNDSP